MSAMSVPTSSPSATHETPAKGQIGLVVLASIAAGLVLGLVFVLGVFAGADEPRITGSALVAAHAEMSSGHDRHVHAVAAAELP